MLLIVTVATDPGDLSAREHKGESIRMTHAPNRFTRTYSRPKRKGRERQAGNLDQARVGAVA